MIWQTTPSTGWSPTSGGWAKAYGISWCSATGSCCCPWSVTASRPPSVRASSELDRLSALLDLPVAQLKAVDRARWIPLEDIVSFGLKGKLIKVATLTLKDGTPMEVRVTDDTQGVDVGMEALGSLLAPVRTF